MSVHSSPSGPEIVIKAVLTLGKYLFHEIHHPWECVSLRVQRVGRSAWIYDQMLGRCRGKGGVGFGTGARARAMVWVKVRVRIKARARAYRLGLGLG